MVRVLGSNVILIDPEVVPDYSLFMRTVRMGCDTGRRSRKEIAVTMKVLVVEDEVKIASFVTRGLEEAGIAVHVCHDGDRGYEEALGRSFDALVLDIMLPGRDGLSILADLRARKYTTPIILLTARSEVEERVEGLAMGADDYLTKPFYIEELIARLHAVTRRADREQTSVLEHGSLTVNLLTREVLCKGEPIDLTAREFALLQYLMRSPGRVFTRTQILEHVWQYSFDPSTNIVDVYIRRLRKKLEPEERLIETVRGVGYRIPMTDAS